MFKRILVATDGSDLGGKAVTLAAEMAATNDASLDVVHVQTDDPIAESLMHMVEIEHLAELSGDQQSRAIDMPGPPNVAMVQAPTGSAAAWKVANAIGKEILKRAEKDVRALGVKNVRAHLEQGDPAKSILDTAAKVEADLIVQGSRGLGQIKRLVLGSVSQEVTQKSACTCMTVK